MLNREEGVIELPWYALFNCVSLAMRYSRINPVEVLKARSEWLVIRGQCSSVDIWLNHRSQITILSSLTVSSHIGG